METLSSLADTDPELTSASSRYAGSSPVSGYYYAPSTGEVHPLPLDIQVSYMMISLEN